MFSVCSGGVTFYWMERTIEKSVHHGISPIVLLFFLTCVSIHTWIIDSTCIGRGWIATKPNTVSKLKKENLKPGFSKAIKPKPWPTHVSDHKILMKHIVIHNDTNCPKFAPTHWPNSDGSCLCHTSKCCFINCTHKILLFEGYGISAVRVAPSPHKEN